MGSGSLNGYHGPLGMIRSRKSLLFLHGSHQIPEFCSIFHNRSYLELGSYLSRAVFVLTFCVSPREPDGTLKLSMCGIKTSGSWLENHQAAEQTT